MKIYATVEVQLQALNSGSYTKRFANGEIFPNNVGLGADLSAGEKTDVSAVVGATNLHSSVIQPGV
jgi:hypothetical protein